MLEPGELPLMRELPVLMKKKQGLKDPFKLPSSKSPLLQASPSNLSTMASLQRLHGNEWEDYCKDFYQAPEFHDGMCKTNADMRLSWDMSEEACFELDSMCGDSTQHESIVEHFDRWRVSEEHRDWEYVACEASPTTSNSGEEGDSGGGRGYPAYPSLLFQSNTDGWQQSPPQRQFARLVKPAHRMLQRDHSSKQGVSTPKPVPQVELMHNRHSYSAVRRETQSRPDWSVPQVELMHNRHSYSAVGRETQSRPDWPVAASVATKRTVSTTPKQRQTLGEPELAESQMHSLELHEGMAVKSQVNSGGQRKLQPAKVSNASRRRAARQPPRMPGLFSYSSMKSSALENGPSTKPRCWSGPQDNFDTDVSTSSSVEEHGCERINQNDPCDDNKIRHHKQTPSTIEEANCLQLALADRKDLVLKENKPRSLSQKYRPRAFGEIIGQHIVTQSLFNAILKGKIVPVYLFQGPRGTGKTSAARIFAAALICVAPQEQRPCGHCDECASVRSGKSPHVKEVDAASHNGITKVKVLLEEVTLASTSLKYKVFIIDECHVLTAETWNALLKILEEPPMNVVFILITTDPDPLPRTAVSRCQKFPFPKIKDADIIKRLMTLTSHEGLSLDLEVLKLIASRSDGSLRDAEIILDQLSLLGKEIDSSTVHELVGSASDGRILSLLDSALLADTVNTIKKARELVDSGVQPLSLMSLMATLIIDILAGSYQFTEEQRRGFFRRQTLSEDRLERLRKAVKILSEAEKQLRISTDKMTWLTAALLQLGPDRSCMFPVSGSGTSIAQSPNTLVGVEHEVADIEHSSLPRRHYRGDASVSINSHTSTERGPLAVELPVHDGPVLESDIAAEPFRSSGLATSNPAVSNSLLDTNTKSFLCTPEDIDKIWFRVVQICRPFRLRQSLHGHGKLVSISLSEVNAMVHLEFIHPKHKTWCERSWKNISSAFEEVLGCPVEVKYSLVSEYGIQQLGFASCNLSEQRFSEDFISKGSTNRPDCDVTMQSSGGLVNNFTLKDSQHFPTLSQDPNSCTSKDIQCLRARSQACLGASKSEGSNFRTCETTSCMGMKERSVEAKLLSSEEQLDKAWICDAERYSSSSDAVNMSHGDIIYQSGDYEEKEALPDTLPVKTCFTLQPHCMNPHGWACEDVREVVELDVLSFDSHTFGLKDDLEEENQIVLGGVEGCTGLESASLEKKKGNTLTVMQRLALRSRNRSLTENYQHSIEEREGPACAIAELQRNSRSSNDTRFSDNVSDCTAKAGSRILSAPPLKNKLRGAAGNVARFFQGKLLRNSQDTFAQCI